MSDAGGPGTGPLAAELAATYGVGSWKPRIGITWGKGTPEFMPKLLLYADCVRAAGGEPVAVLPLERVGDAIAYISKHDTGLFQLHAGEGASPRDFDGLVMAGGPDIDPVHYGSGPTTDTLEVDDKRDAIEVPLLEKALKLGVPVLGICRGFQLVNVVLGGKLIQDIPSQLEGAVPHGKGVMHELAVTPGSILHDLAGASTVVVNSWHHQGLTPEGLLAPGLTPTAFSPDGLIEAFEPEPDRVPGYLHAVQWHPERPSDDDGPVARALTRALFGDFIAACAKRAQTSDRVAR